MLLDRFGMADAKAAPSPAVVGQKFQKTGEPVDEGTPFAELVGALLYIAVMARPDIAYAVGVLCRYMSEPTKEHWFRAKRILRYLTGTKEFGIVYTKGKSDVVAYGDSDHAADVDTRKSRSGTVS
jgi:hypothetical protein